MILCIASLPHISNPSITVGFFSPAFKRVHNFECIPFFFFNHKKVKKRRRKEKKKKKKKKKKKEKELL